MAEIEDPQSDEPEGPRIPRRFADLSQDGADAEVGLEVEDDAAERTLDDESIAGPVARRPSRLGLQLVGVGAVLWGIVLTLRWWHPTTDAPTPPLSVDTEPDQKVEPDKDEGWRPETPQPAIERPDEDGPVEAVDRDRDASGADPANDVAPTPRALRLGPAPSPRPTPAPWVERASIPATIHYTIRRGGSLENVANLFKIYHHEIVAMNPGLELQQELAPQSRVVIFERPDDFRSESVGLPSGGSVEGGVPMVEGPGRELKAIPWKSWGTASTVAILDHLLRDWADRGHRQPILIGNMASRNGGRLQPHHTHQSGRDVDLGYPQKLASGAELNWAEINEINLDRDETWALLFLLASSGAVEVIYVDRSIQKLLYEHATAEGLIPKSKLTAWMEYPRATGSGDPLLQHVPGHVDHLHVRFRCLSHEKRCRSKP